MEPSWNDITPPPPPPPGYYFYQTPGSAGPVWTTTPPPTPPSLAFPTPSQTPSPQTSDPSTSSSSSLRPPLSQAPSPQTSDPSSSHRPLNTEVSSGNTPSPAQTSSPQTSYPSSSLRPPSHVNLELSLGNAPSSLHIHSPQTSDSSSSKRSPAIRAPSPQPVDPFGPWFQSSQHLECSSSPPDSSSSKRPPPPIRAPNPQPVDPFGPWFRSSQHLEHSSQSGPSSSNRPPPIRASSPQPVDPFGPWFRSSQHLECSSPSDPSLSKRPPPIRAPKPQTIDPFGPWSRSGSFQSPQHMECTSSRLPLPRQDTVTSSSQMPPPPFLPQFSQAMDRPSSSGKLPQLRAPAHHLKKPSSTQQPPVLNDFLGLATGSMIPSSTSKGPSHSGTKRSISDVTSPSFSHNQNFIPNQNPNLNSASYPLNPNINHDHNPNLNHAHNPNLNHAHNPNMHSNQNPNVNDYQFPDFSAPNSNLNPNQNPNTNHDQHPIFNPTHNPNPNQNPRPIHNPNPGPAHNPNLNQNLRPILNPNTTQGLQRDTMSFRTLSCNPLQNSNQPKTNPTMISRLPPPPPQRGPSFVERFTRNCEQIRSLVLSLEPTVVPDDSFPGATKVVFKQAKKPQPSGSISIGGQSTSLERQMVILYGNQTQVVENVHPNKVRQIIRDAQAPLQPVQPYQVSTSTHLQANTTELLANSAPMRVTELRPHDGSSEVINVEDSPGRTTVNESNAQPSEATSSHTELVNNQNVQHLPTKTVANSADAPKE